MYLVRSAVLFLALIGSAHAQQGCVPNPNVGPWNGVPTFVNGCPIPAAALNLMAPLNNPPFTGFSFSNQSTGSLAGPNWASPPASPWDALRISVNNFPSSAENQSSQFQPFGIVGAIELPSNSFGTGGSAFGVAGYARQNSLSGTPLGAVGIYGQGSTTVSNTNADLWGANFLVSNAPHSDGDTSGFTVAGMFGAEVNVNVKSTSAVSAVWPTNLQAFGVQVVGNSTAQVGDGGGAGLSSAFYVNALGINTSPPKKWGSAYGTNDGTAVSGLYLGAAAIAAANVNGQPVVWNWYDNASANQQFSVAPNTVAAGTLLFTGSNVSPNYMFRVKTGQDVFFQASGSGVGMSGTNDANAANVPMTLGGSTLTLQATGGLETLTATAGIILNPGSAQVVQQQVATNVDLFSSNSSGTFLLTAGNDANNATIPLEFNSTSQQFRVGTNVDLMFLNSSGTFVMQGINDNNSANIPVTLSGTTVNLNPTTGNLQIKGTNGSSRTCTVNTNFTLIFTNGILTGGTCSS